MITNEDIKRLENFKLSYRSKKEEIINPDDRINLEKLYSYKDYFKELQKFNKDIFLIDIRKYFDLNPDAIDLGAFDINEFAEEFNMLLVGKRITNYVDNLVKWFNDKRLNLIYDSDNNETVNKLIIPSNYNYNMCENSWKLINLLLQYEELIKFMININYNMQDYDLKKLLDDTHNLICELKSMGLIIPKGTKEDFKLNETWYYTSLKDFYNPGGNYNTNLGYNIIGVRKVNPTEFEKQSQYFFYIKEQKEAYTYRDNIIKANNVSLKCDKVGKNMKHEFSEDTVVVNDNFKEYIKGIHSVIYCINNILAYDLNLPESELPAFDTEKTEEIKEPFVDYLNFIRIDTKNKIIIVPSNRKDEIEQIEGYEIEYIEPKMVVPIKDIEEINSYLKENNDLANYYDKNSYKRSKIREEILGIDSKQSKLQLLWTPSGEKCIGSDREEN